MLQINKKRLRRLWQLLVISICLVTVVMLFVYSNNLNNRNYKMLFDQTEDMARLFLRQMAVSAVPAISDDNTGRLEKLVNNLQKEPLVLDATIYNAEGLVIANSDNAMPLSQLTGLNTPLSVASIGRQQLVEPIIKGDRIVGFLRVTLEHGSVIKAAANRLDKSINLVRAMILLALATGAWLAFTLFHRKTGHSRLSLPIND
ncbi:YtjB family periplasmic protein [Veronia pacifica]|uniref:SMP protein n=1 Tax=Veronia pacifica TaxID=1080227 RepID=A0A1C3EK58_9GAMM|nr:AhpA/YtjB family protein [Veronia pacifica]ODA33618.1 hypothetical protein A8L45_09550 [Veronia pacifica]